MNKKLKSRAHRLTALLLALVTICSLFTTPAFASQDPAYHDPAEHWMTSNDRVSELDANAIVTHETANCRVCGKTTSFLIWRVPEYTTDGKSALTRNVLYSDGTMVGGEGVGSLMNGTPGKDAYYTGYHWTKSMCETCGTMNSKTTITGYSSGKNVYYLYDCAAEFMEKLPETAAYEYADDTYHRVTKTTGEYCVFCFGTRKSTNSTLERHTMKTEVLPQPANGRFATVDRCTLCGYTKYDYTAAKAVIASYFGVADGKPHTITVTDLSESGVTASIRYGSSADACTLTAAPTYTEAGQYTVYYQITYAFQGKNMTENGAAYVWLRDESVKEDGSCGCGCGDPDCGCHKGSAGSGCGCGKSGCTGSGSCAGTCGGTCSSCNSCGGSGVCGDDHHFTLLDSVEPGCLTLGYDRYLCTKCGKIEKRDYEAALGHAFQSVLIREADCETDGKLLEICARCGLVKTTSTPKGEHKYSTHTVAATCTGPGYTVKECSVCGDRHITDITDPLPHSYAARVTPPTCTAMGCTTYTCRNCGHTYHDSYTPLTSHRESDWIVDKEPTTDSEGERHKECQDCGENLESESIPRLNDQDITDSHGEAEVGGYLVIVTDTDTKSPVMGAVVSLLLDESLTIRLPDGRLLDYADQTTVTVLIKKDKSAVPGVDIAVTDANDNYSAGTTDKAGQITVPGASGKTNDNGKATVGGEDEDGNRYPLTVKVEDYESGRPIPDALVSIGRTGRVSVTLPDGEDMDEQNRITVTVTDHKKVPQEGLTVVVKSDLGRTEEGITDKAGKVTVPPVTAESEEVRHAAYIVGYPDSTFRPASNMTRSEAAAIFARILAAQKGETVPLTASAKFTDIPAKAWYTGYVNYLSGYGIVTGRGKNTFAPNAPITRAEFTAMAVRFFAVYGSGNAEIMEQYKQFSDVASGSWAAQYIEDAAKHGWVLGYGDGTFGPEKEITRAEVVTLVNRLLDRDADMDFIRANLRTLVVFPDVRESTWYYGAVMEAANNHTAKMGDTEIWSR